MIKAVLLDMDDTLLHLDVDWRAVKDSITSILEESGHKFSRGVARNQIRFRGTDAGKDIENLVEGHEDNGWETSTLLPHAKEAVEALAKEYKLAIVTGNGLKVAKKALEHHGLSQYFSVIASREDGIKPEPEPILKAIERLGCAKDEAVMVGNSDSDMLAAKAAGVRSIGYTSTMTAEELKSYGAETTIGDLMELKDVIK